MLSKNKFNYLQLIFTVLLFTGKSQTIFQRTFGDTLSEYSFSAKQTNDKGYILSGYTDSYAHASNDYYLVKTDSMANVMWSKVYSGLNHDEAYSVQQTSDGGYILAGSSKSWGSLYYDACIIKTNSAGDTLWTKNYGAAGSEFANTIIQTSDGGYVFAGYTINNAIDSAQGSIFLVKLNPNGTLRWKKVLGPSKEYTDAYSIKQTTDKGFIITGYTDGYNEINGDVFLLKTDSLGNPAFVKTYGNKGADWAYAVEQTPDGGFIIGGTYSTDSTGLDLDAYIIKTDANGDTLWTKTYGGTGNEYGQSLTQTSDGGYVLGGYSNNFTNGNYDMFLLKVNANGDTIFSRSFGGYNDDEANAVFQTSDGGFALCGQTNSFGKGGYDFYFVKTDANGNSSCFQTNIHSAKKKSTTIVSTVSMKQDTIHVMVATIHPAIYTGATLTDNCTTVGVNEFTIVNTELKIYPNPTTGNFTINVVDFSGNAKINITNLLGENVYAFSGEMSGEKELNLKNLSNGTYFIQITAEGRIHNGKILVNK